MKRVGLREANQRFSELVKLLRAGQSALLTHRGKPLAVVRPLPESADAEAAIRRLEALGLLRSAVKHCVLPRWTARRLRGVPISQTVRDDRDYA
jgi:prevent-host-death family protein